jgi:ZIP family zinc transporter
VIDRALKRRGTPVSQLIALNLDFIPEAIVLGAVISGNFEMALFLTAIIVAQNLPEGFNAYREIRHSHSGFLRKHVLQIMSGSIVVGPVAALAGYSLFTLDNMLLGSIMTFCAGGILYLVFEDVAPDAHRAGDWRPALGAVIGFSVALVGYGLTG